MFRSKATVPTLTLKVSYSTVGTLLSSTLIDLITNLCFGVSLAREETASALWLRILFVHEFVFNFAVLRHRVRLEIERG